MSTEHINHQHHQRPHLDSYPSPPITLILTIVLLIFFFIGFFSIYFCRCFMDYVSNATWFLHRNPASNTVGNTAPQGLDPSIISSFPTFVYSAVKDLREDKGGLECAVCLSEFEDSDVLRLLTVCNHVFHPDCIDLWLESHKTCPVCRRNLDPSENSPAKSPVAGSTIPEMDENEDDSREETLSIAVKEEEEGRGGNFGGGGTAVEMSRRGAEGNGVEKFSRSHSTGHSIVRRGQEDRFTLRLPDNVKMRITGSCITFGEFSGNAAAGKGGLGEISGFSGGVVARV